MRTGDVLAKKPPGRVRGRPFEKGQSGNPAGRQPRRRNNASLAAEALLESAGDVATAMAAVTVALATGAITPGEAEAIARVVDTFIRAIPGAAPRTHGEILAAADRRRGRGADPQGRRARPRRRPERIAALSRSHPCE
jgi:Family of unknown function (DUF5681)